MNRTLLVRLHDGSSYVNTQMQWTGFSIGDHVVYDDGSGEKLWTVSWLGEPRETSA